MPRKNHDIIGNRKADHIKICLKKDVSSGENWFDDIELVHEALPEMNFDDVDISCTFLGRKFNAPFVISAITGGTQQGEKINKNLAWAAARTAIPMGLGSQRAMIEKPETTKTFSMKEHEPELFLIGNIGAAQLNAEVAQKAIAGINASALAVHINPSHEACQPEGDVNFRGVLDKIKEVCRSVGVPVIAKEVGHGLSKEAAKKLEKAGVSVLDVQGRGGTSWNYVESFRSNSKSGKLYRKWGVPTPVSLIESLESIHLPVIASGGIRNGLHAAKMLALGASMVGFALPMLEPACKSKEAVKEALDNMTKELRVAMFLTGSKNIDELRKKPVLILGKTKEWLELRGFDVRKYARR